MHRISKEPEYLLVTMEGEATYQSFRDALEEELARDDYPNMNDIWRIDNCILAVNHEQFANIVNDLLEIYPRQATRTKTALVAASGISRALAQFWTEHAEMLPYDIQIFMSLSEAEAWIT